MRDVLTYLFDSISFGSVLSCIEKSSVFRWVSNCARHIAKFLFCFERGFRASLSYNKEAEIIQEFKAISRYLDDRFKNIENPYFEGMLSRIYPPELQFNKANRLILNSHFCIYIYVF